MLETLSFYWPHLATALGVLISLVASGHAVLFKRDVRAAIGWVGIIWLTPLLGALLYLFFGINRIHRRAQSLLSFSGRSQQLDLQMVCQLADMDRLLGPDAAHLRSLVRLVEDVTQRPLLSGNRVQPLRNGDEAFPAMLHAISEARDTVTLSSYIFDNDRAGKMFRDALAAAVRRGVEVRVLIDDVGSRYTWPSIVGSLRHAGVPVATFLPTLVPWRFRYSNLRNHRKMLVVDGRTGFTGGINIREGNLLKLQTRHPVQDYHFRLNGPVVAHLQEAFVFDWEFATGEVLQGERWFPPDEVAGTALARGISDGPDDDFDRLRMVLLGGIASARTTLNVVTPYFLPDEALITALNVAAMRGVEVNIVLPAQNNLTMVKWASTAQLREVIERSCRVWLAPPPFDHSKLMVVDGVWTLFGSANWDPRSLRLNFEMNVESYDRQLAQTLDDFIQSRIRQSRQVTLDELHGRSLLVKLRDGVARLASPYL